MIQGIFPKEGMLDLLGRNKRIYYVGIIRLTGG